MNPGGLIGSVVKNSCANAGDTGDADSTTGSRNSWRKEWQPTPAFLPGKSHGQRSLAATVHGVAKSQTRLNTHAYSLISKPSLLTIIAFVK